MDSWISQQESNHKGNTVESQKLSARKEGHWLKSLAISLLMVPVWFLIFEGVLWLAGYEPQTPLQLMAFINPEWRDKQIFQLDPDLFWRFRPNQRVKGDSKEHGQYSIRINNLGFRGPDFPDPRAEGAVRLMFLGDSCVFGWDAPEGENFPMQLVKYLDEGYPARDFHAFVGGIPGYTSFQARQVLQLYGAAYGPDFVIVYLGTNDSVPCVNFPDAELMSRMEQWWTNASLLQKSRLYQLVGQLLRKPDEDKKSLLEIARSLDHKEGPFRVALDDFEENLREIVKMSREQLGAQPLFLTRQDLRPQFRVVLYNERMRQLGRRLEVPVVEVAEGFAGRPEPEKFYANPKKDKIHPNALGYESIARLTFESIQENQLLVPEGQRLDASTD